MSLAKLLESVEMVYQTLKPAERRVADLFRSDPHFFHTASLFEIAISAGVSEGSVSRFCKTVNVVGLAELQRRITAE